MGVKMTGVHVSILVFGLNSGAYISEIMRSGILSVDHGQMEAGRAVGLKLRYDHDENCHSAGGEKYSADSGK